LARYRASRKECGHRGRGRERFILVQVIGRLWSHAAADRRVRLDSVAAPRRPVGGLFGLGRSRAKRYSDEQPKVTFDDVAGIDEAENELIEIIDFLKNPAKYQRLGGTVPKGVLLVGAPGTGKTLLARAIAGQAGVPFFSLSASEFVEMIVGVGASRVRDLFRQAREAAPAIIFIGRAGRHRPYSWRRRAARRPRRARADI